MKVPLEAALESVLTAWFGTLEDLPEALEVRAATKVTDLPKDKILVIVKVTEIIRSVGHLHLATVDLMVGTPGDVPGVTVAMGDAVESAVAAAFDDEAARDTALQAALAVAGADFTSGGLYAEGWVDLPMEDNRFVPSYRVRVGIIRAVA